MCLLWRYLSCRGRRAGRLCLRCCRRRGSRYDIELVRAEGLIELTKASSLRELVCFSKLPPYTKNFSASSSHGQYPSSTSFYRLKAALEAVGRLWLRCHQLTSSPSLGLRSAFTLRPHHTNSHTATSSVLQQNKKLDMINGRQKGKNIQQRVFASGHPPNY